MREFGERFASVADVVYGILTEIGLVCLMMMAAYLLGWVVIGWPL